MQHIAITAHRDDVIARVAALAGDDREVVAKSPYVLVGSVGEIVVQLEEARARWGFSYFVTREAESTGSVIAALTH